MRGFMRANSKALLSITGALEGATGLALLLVPSVVVELLLGVGPGTAVDLTVSRVAGGAVLALAVASWLARDDASARAARGLVAALLLYNVAVTVILVLAWTGLGLLGIALWGVVLVHSALAAWCVACLSK